MASPFPRALGWALLGGICLMACVGTPGRGIPRRYSLDSLSTACARNPTSCATLSGKETLPVVAATAGAGAVVLGVLSQALRDRIEEELARCADMARSEVLLRHRTRFARPSPSKDECRQWTQDAQGKRVTWAMRLGSEMHDVAFVCTRQRLNELRPGGYSIEPCYRYDKQTKKTTHITCEEIQALLENGCGSDLKGTIRPDVVIHSGNPLQAQAVYDYKFPCVNTDTRLEWRKYPPDHPCAPLDQGQLYEAALGPEPQTIQPRLGVQP